MKMFALSVIALGCVGATALAQQPMPYNSQTNAGYGWGSPGSQPIPHDYHSHGPQGGVQGPAQQRQAFAPRRPTSGRYLGVFGGFNAVDDLDISGAGLSATAETKGGSIWGAAFGSATYGPTGMYTRWELEGSYRSNGLGDLDLLGLSAAPDGDLTALGVHLNGYIGLPVGRMITVYGGGGIGLSRLDAGIELGDISFEETINASFSYQVMAGVEIAISPVFSVFSEYRYYNANSELGFDALQSLGDSVDVDIDPFSYKSHGFIVGGRLYF